MNDQRLKLKFILKTLGYVFMACFSSATVRAAAPDDIASSNIRIWLDALDTQAVTSPASNYSSTVAVPTYPGSPLPATGITATGLITSWKSKVNGYTAASTYSGLTAPSTSITYPGIGALYNSNNDALAVQGDIWGVNAAVSTPEMFVVTSPTSTTATTFIFDSQQGRANTAARISAHFPWSGGLIYWDPGNTGGSVRSAAYTPSVNNLAITNWLASSVNREVIINATSTILTGSPSATYTNVSTVANPSYYTLGGGEANNSYLGVISENIVYNRLLLTAEKRILNNYLSAKWGMSIGAEDRYAGDSSASGLYRYHVGGIGSEASGNQATGTSEGLTIMNGSFLAAGRYLIAGLPGLSAAGTMIAYNQSNAGTSAKVITAPQLLRGSVTTDLPVTAWWRGARVWYLDKTDASASAGIINLTFDITGKMGITTPNVDPLPATAVTTGQPLQLLFRSTLTGNFSTVMTANATSASSVTFAVPANLLADGYYTIGDYRPPKPSLAKTVALISDPVNGTSSPKNIPGGIVEYAITVSNVGESPLITGATNSLVLTDVIPSYLEMNSSVNATCANNASLMTFSSANTIYYSDVAATTVMTPVAGYDSAIKAIKLFPQGQLNCADSNPKCPAPHTLIPSCTYTFLLRIK